MKYSVKFRGKQYEVEVERLEEDFRALTKREVSEGVVTQIPAAPSASEKKPAPAMIPQMPLGTTTVISPMPGSVLGVNVAVGEQVKAGQVLVLIEAMKMENEIVAPVDGVVENIPVKKGDIVDTDAVLAVLK